MIHFRCSKCSHHLAVIEEHAGKTAKCPNCGATLAVPDPTLLETLLRPEAEHTETTPSPISSDAPPPLSTKPRGFIRRNVKKLAALAVLIGMVVVALIIYQSRGNFPSRKRVEAVLHKSGYDLFSPVPQVGVLRGRRLNCFSFVLDANNVDLGRIWVWCPLDNPDRVVALSCQVQSFDRIKDRPLIASQETRQLAALREAHSYSAPQVLEKLSGVYVGPVWEVWNFDNAPDPAVGEDGYTHNFYHGGGFQLEVCRSKIVRTKIETGYGIHDAQDYHELLILQDKSWPRVER